MKKFENAEIEVIRFEAEDVVVASCSSVCSWDCYTVCASHDCSNVCTGVQKS